MRYHIWLYFGKYTPPFIFDLSFYLLRFTASTWQSNVPKIDKHFIRALTTVVLHTSLKPGTYRVIDDIFNNGVLVMNRYIQNKEQNELECLFALQILMNNLEYPSGKSLKFNK